MISCILSILYVMVIIKCAIITNGDCLYVFVSKLRIRSTLLNLFLNRSLENYQIFMPNSVNYVLWMRCFKHLE